MPARPDAWAAYFYPGTATLCNIPGITDPDELREFEYAATARRQRHLDREPSLIERTYDARHLRAIHHYLFQDVYDWAGQYRTVNMVKNPAAPPFADADGEQIDRYLADAHRIITTTDWPALDHRAFAEAAATVFAHVNQAHPFREGNGRASKAFMDHIADLSPYEFDFARVERSDWNRASELSRPDLGAYPVHPDLLVPVFEAIAERRPAALGAPEQSLGRVRRLYGLISSQPTDRAPQNSQRRATSPPQAPRRRRPMGPRL